MVQAKVNYFYKILLLVLFPAVTCNAQSPGSSYFEPELIESFEPIHSDVPNNIWQHSELIYEQASFNFDQKIKGFVRKDKDHAHGSLLPLILFHRSAINSISFPYRFILFRNLRL